MCLNWHCSHRNHRTKPKLTMTSIFKNRSQIYCVVSFFISIQSEVKIEFTGDYFQLWVNTHLVTIYSSVLVWITLRGFKINFRGHKTINRIRKQKFF